MNEIHRSIHDETVAPQGILGFRGAVVGPDDPSYDEARRVWNADVDRRPAAIARCMGTADVLAAVRHARDRGIAVSVRGGGHQVAGQALCDDGLVIDCSPMRGIRVDPRRRTARAQAGVLWGELDHETQAFGLAVTGGVVTHTGIAGLTLGGGLGWLMRKHGLTIDNLLSVDLVTAEGELLHASEDENPELFWGVRGGGGNFGVVTAFEYALHPVGPAVLGGPVFWSLDAAPEVLRFYRDWVETAPDELTTVLKLGPTAPDPAVPEAFHGRPACGVIACWAGPLEKGEEVLRPLRTLGRPLLDGISEKSYAAHQAMIDPSVPHGLHWYWKASETGRLADPVIDTLVEHTAAITSPLSYTAAFHLGGAVARVPEEATAYSHRDAVHAVNVNAGWRGDDPEPARHVEWARAFHAALEPDQVGVYVNFLGDEGAERVRAAYGPEKYERLMALKRRYDPDNFFRLNQNIPPPARSTGSA